MTCGPFCQGSPSDHEAPGTGYFPCFPCGHVAPSQEALDAHSNRGHVTPTPPTTDPAEAARLLRYVGADVVEACGGAVSSASRGFRYVPGGYDSTRPEARPW